MGFFDLHRHDEMSTFDGFGKPHESVSRACELGYTALAISNHGNTSSCVSHYFACKEAGIKPIMGVEAYFQPQFEEVRESYHLCLYVKNLKGYRNLNKLLSEANKKQYYYKAIVDFNLLEKYSEGLICTSACIAGYLSQCLFKNKNKTARKAAKRFKEIFGDDFYIELQPYTVTTEDMQEEINVKLLQLADKLGIECVLTTDSHFVKAKDFDTYLKLHEIGGHLELGEQYSQRYLPSEEEVKTRFLQMHGDDSEYYIPKAKNRFKQFIQNLGKISEKVDDEILELLPLRLPVHVADEDSKSALWEHIVSGLKTKGKHTKKYIKRCKQEYDVIVYHDFEDYFLVVEDYVKWAKEHDIIVGPGRGSVCNSLVAYALGITNVDSILFDLDFNRFMRKDKKKLPDIDVDFETSRRDEVIDYLINKYKSKAARISSYGLYKVDNLLNDLFKVCGLGLCDKSDDRKEYLDKDIKDKQKEIKRFVRKYIDSETGEFDYEKCMLTSDARLYNRHYDNIIKHFSKMYMKTRFFGTHAAGVAISGSNIKNYTAIERRKGNVYTTSYDLNDIELINAIKFDMLSLRTLSILKELREITGEDDFNYDWLEDDSLYEQFAEGNTDGIFQFESNSAKSVLQEINVEDIHDVIAASALNRPGPLSGGMVQQYAENKGNPEEVKNSVWYNYSKDSYGTFLYQEQIMRMCVGLGGMSWDDADKMMKIMKKAETVQKLRQDKNSILYELQDKFVLGCKVSKISKKVALELFETMLIYAFNKGHATGYGLISLEQMYYKVYYTTDFWYVTLKYATDMDKGRLTSKAVRDGCVVLYPHVNHSAMHTLEIIEGDECICEGLSSVKNVGLKAAEAIENERLQNGDYISKNDFLNRMSGMKRTVNKRTIDALEEAGSLIFNKDIYYQRVAQYNSALYGRYAD